MRDVPSFRQTIAGDIKPGTVCPLHVWWLKPSGVWACDFPAGGFSWISTGFPTSQRQEGLQDCRGFRPVRPGPRAPTPTRASGADSSARRAGRARGQALGAPQPSPLPLRSTHGATSNPTSSLQLPPGADDRPPGLGKLELGVQRSLYGPPRRRGGSGTTTTRKLRAADPRIALRGVVVLPPEPHPRPAAGTTLIAQRVRPRFPEGAAVRVPT